MEKNKFTHGSLFSGIGGPEIAAEEMGWKNMFHCEINPFGRKILDYWFPNSKSYEDITKTNFTEWRGKINVLTGGFPCQPFSCAGQRKGAEDDRYLWPEMLRAIREIQPDWVVGENVAGILSMVQPGSETALGREESLFGEVDRKRILHRQEYVVETVCNDLEREGYFVQPVVIPACAVGAPHRRDRVFFIAHRADAGVKGMQRKWEDNILSGRTASDTTCRGSGGTPHESCCENERQNGYETQQPFVRGCVRASSHSDGERCNNRSDNWKERPICYDQKRDSEEADMVYHHTKSKVPALEWELQTKPPTLRGKFWTPQRIAKLAFPFHKHPDGSPMAGEEVFDRLWGEDVPAWSLCRLLELLPTEIRIGTSENVFGLHHETSDAWLLSYPYVKSFETASPVESCVLAIDWLIANGHFNKEYYNEENNVQ